MCSFSDVAANMQPMPPIRPINMPHIGVVNPLAGVITPNPATAPEIAPSTVGLPVFSHSAITQPSAPAAAAKCVATNALLANPPAASALPALKPNHPTHSSAAPITESTTLCGVIAVRPNPMRGPSTSAQISADTPELTCTTVPPAKSSAPKLSRESGRNALNSPPLPQTMCAI